MTNELNEKDLENVQGGAIDWKEFGTKFLNTLNNSQVELTIEHKKLVEAIKNKNWIEVAIIATPLVAKDPVIAKLLYECNK